MRTRRGLEHAGLSLFAFASSHVCKLMYAVVAVLRVCTAPRCFLAEVRRGRRSVLTAKASDARLEYSPAHKQSDLHAQRSELCSLRLFQTVEKDAKGCVTRLAFVIYIHGRCSFPHVLASYTGCSASRTALQQQCTLNNQSATDEQCVTPALLRLRTVAVGI